MPMDGAVHRRVVDFGSREHVTSGVSAVRRAVLTLLM